MTPMLASSSSIKRALTRLLLNPSKSWNRGTSEGERGRNMERLALACGGYAVNSVEGLSPDCTRSHADLVYEHVLGDDKFTFVEGVKNPFNGTILLKGSCKARDRAIERCRA